MGRFVIRKTQTGFVFCLKAANGETIATSEVYKTLAGCKKGVCSVVRNAAAETLYLDGETPQSVRNPRYELYQDAAGRCRFRLRAKNGEIIAVSEDYLSKSGCENGIASVRRNAPDARVAVIVSK